MVNRNIRFVPHSSNSEIFVYPYTFENGPFLGAVNSFKWVTADMKSEGYKYEFLELVTDGYILRGVDKISLSAVRWSIKSDLTLFRFDSKATVGPPGPPFPVLGYDSKQFFVSMKSELYYKPSRGLVIIGENSTYHFEMDVVFNAVAGDILFMNMFVVFNRFKGNN
jgi:hypothetical protein